MLEFLHIENIAVIEKADVAFDSGFITLTGETGAGKSIVIDSINAVLGERTSKDLIRSGTDKATVSAVFSALPQKVYDILGEYGIECDDGNVMISRVITPTKSTAKINSQTVTASVLREIAPLLINIHGQHDSQALLDADKHYMFIDMLANNKEIIDDYKKAFAEMQAVRRKIKTISENNNERERRAELLRFQVNELENAEITIGEWDELKAVRRAIDNSKMISEKISAVYYLLSGDDNGEFSGALGLTEDAEQALMEISEVYPEATNLLELLENAKASLEEVKSEVYSYQGGEMSEEEIARIDARLEMYYSFSKKYGSTESDMLEFLENAKTELTEIDDSDTSLQELSGSLNNLVTEVKSKAKYLCNSRMTAAKNFEKNVAAQLEFLNMPKTKIKVEFTDVPYSSNGNQKIEFLISTNEGEPEKPLSKIASGGEMSRIMLAIKNVLASNDEVKTLIFDEIDAGISGRAAQKVGIKLKETAYNKQVICVTHLAQIASLADKHLLIDKKIENNRAVTTITPLSFEGRTYELARIIGSEITETNLQSAKEMLESAKKL